MMIRTNIGIIVPAYLPNECKILSNVLNHYRLVIESSSHQQTKKKVNLYILLVHNGKLESVAEQDALVQELLNIHDNIHVVENETSRSKAENINFGIDFFKNLQLSIDIVSIFDADHKPNLSLFESVAEIFDNSAAAVDIIQGRCAVRFDDTFLSKMIAIEFSELYSLYHNGGSKLRGFGLFGGSNGHWKFPVIDDIRFNPGMMTEDIDSTMRALAAGYTIRYCNDIISYELAPPTLKALYVQRMRWAQGWAEVTWKNTWSLMRSRHLTIWKKMCCFVMLPFREIYYYLTMHIAYVGSIYLIKMGFNLWPTYVITALSMFLLLFLITKSFLVYLTSQHCATPSAIYFLLYALVSLPYEIFKIYIVYFAHLQFLFKERTWRTTPRDGT
jgi:cellulose synthase/poly-beta-1,6-N-acetylglucosamine synthase-like glycosyltransferase